MLRQKQELLAKATGETKDRLKTLNEALTQLKTSGQNIDPERMNALKREIIETEQNLKRLEQQTKETGTAMSRSFKEAGEAVQKAGDTMKAAGDKMQKAGTALTAGVTAPITAAAGASVKAFTEVQDSLDTVTKKTGASGEALADMQARAENLATTIPTSFEKAGIAVGEVNTRFGATGQELEDLAKYFIEFSDLNGLDLNSTIDKTQKVMAAFNLETKDAAAMLDALNKAGQDSGVGLDRLLDTATSSGAAFRELGFNSAQTIDFISRLEKSGADTSKVLTGLQKALVYSQNNGKDLPTVFSEFLTMAEETEDKTTVLNRALEIFGNKAGPALAEAAERGVFSLDELRDSFEETAGSVDETYKATLHGTDSITTTVNSLKLLGAEFGRLISDTIGPYLDEAREKILKFRESWQNMDPEKQQGLLKLALGLAALGPSLLILGKAVSLVGSLTTGIGGLVTKLGGLAGGGGFAALASPIGIAAGALTAFIALFAYFYKTSEKFRETVGGIFDKLGEKVENIKNLFAQIFGDIDIKELLENLKESIKAFFDWLEPFFTRFVDVVGDLIGGIIDIFGGLIAMITALFSGDTETAKEAFLTFLRGILDAGYALLVKLPALLFDLLADILEALFTKLLPWILEKIGTFFSTLFKVIIEAISAGIEQLATWIIEKIKGFGETLKMKIEMAIMTLKNLGRVAKEWGKDLIEGFINGILDKFRAFKDTITNIASFIWEKLHFSRPESGPLRDYERWMPDFINGLTNSLKRAQPQLLNAFNELAGGLSLDIANNGTQANGINYGGVSVVINATERQSAEELFSVFDRRLAEMARKKGGLRGYA